MRRNKIHSPLPFGAESNTVGTVIYLREMEGLLKNSLCQHWCFLLKYTTCKKVYNTEHSSISSLCLFDINYFSQIPLHHWDLNSVLHTLPTSISDALSSHACGSHRPRINIFVFDYLRHFHVLRTFSTVRAVMCCTYWTCTVKDRRWRCLMFVPSCVIPRGTVGRLPVHMAVDGVNWLKK